MPTRLTGVNVSVFTLGGNALVGELTNATMEMTTATTDTKGVSDWWADPQAVGASFRITGELQASGTLALMGTAATTNPVVAFTATTSARSYSGTAVISSIAHRIERENVQTYSITLDSKGTVLVT